LRTAILKNYKQILVLWVLGLLGVISLLPVIPQLIAIQNQPIPFSVVQIQIITFVQTGILILVAVILGSIFSRKVNLNAPVIDAVLNRRPVLSEFKPQIIPAFLCGILGGIFIALFSLNFQAQLPQEFLLAAKKLSMPWYTRIFYGGIAEELLVRWGLMSFFVWLFFRCFQNSASEIKPAIYMSAIFASALVFGLGHLPIAHALSSVVTVPLIVYILIGNAVFGLMAGWLYWKYGLECAMISHMLAHITMVVLELILVS